ncbi:hypothetical protein DFH09DRAFT_1140929 [Mycena vulgaris]|nr:hypothetical protein DFH09DRAFT_1140929 [Mycena vulgaris]
MVLATNNSSMSFPTLVAPNIFQPLIDLVGGGLYPDTPKRQARTVTLASNVDSLGKQLGPLVSKTLELNLNIYELALKALSEQDRQELTTEIETLKSSTGPDLDSRLLSTSLKLGTLLHLCTEDSKCIFVDIAMLLHLASTFCVASVSQIDTDDFMHTILRKTPLLGPQAYLMKRLATEVSGVSQPVGDALIFWNGLCDRVSGDWLWGKALSDHMDSSDYRKAIRDLYFARFVTKWLILSLSRGQEIQNEMVNYVERCILLKDLGVEGEAANAKRAQWRATLGQWNVQQDPHMVFQLLRDQDAEANAWTDEDPNLIELLAMAKDQLKGAI